MATDSPVIIEVALNGVTSKDRNPAVPIEPEEIAADIIACAEAGASVFHTHPTRPPAARRGVSDTAEDYATAYRLALADRPDLLLYPTMSGGADIGARYDHHQLLAEEHLIRFGCLDPGSVNLASFGIDGLPSATDFVYTNSPNDVRYMMEVCAQSGLGASLAIYEPGFLRMTLGYFDGGHLPSGSIAKFYFSGDDGFFGRGTPTYSAPPLPEALELYLAMLGDRDLPWAVTLLGGDLLSTPVARQALDRGGHLRVGLEDDPSAESNAVAVARAVDLVAAVGRPVASSADAAAILKLPS